MLFYRLISDDHLCVYLARLAVVERRVAESLEPVQCRGKV